MASSSSPSSKKHEVFLSFRGEDTRRTFTSHLKAALYGKRIDTFIDDKEIERGDEISPTLLAAIERSKISIIIFSKDYASSTWCLEELAKIIECKNEMQHIVLPVFYNVKPSEVRKQSDTYAQAFAKHEKNNQVRVQKWRAALQEAANLGGWDSSEASSESELVDNIVNEVLQKLNRIASPQIPSGLVGVEKKIAQIESLLFNELEDVHILGIWGIGGVGKTTIAEALFRRLSSQYQGCSFVENVREKWKQLGKYELRNKLLTQIFGDQMCIEDRLQRTKVLIVLDDVSDYEQMDYLIGEKYRYGLGSRIIVTTRNKDVLQKEYTGLYEVMPLDREEALQLFCLKAFQQYSPKDEFRHLSNMVIDYVGGIPLAITVLGSSLYSKNNEEEWKGTLEKLKKGPNPKIHSILKLSYKDLDKQDKEIFLDIACCLKGVKKGQIIDLIDVPNSSIVIIGLKNLQDKSLITISESEYVQMHDLIQEMGHHIASKESKHPEKRRRLWDPKDIYDVLQCKTGNNHSTESISLNMAEIKEVQISRDTFARMSRLRLLKFYMRRPLFAYNSPEYPYKCKVNIPEGLECLPDCLRYLCWECFPLEALPPSFHAEMLVKISLPESPIKKLWDGDQDVANLKILWLWRCHNLLELPCLKKATKLQEICLGNCTSLSHVPSYILSLENLSKLSLMGCTQLQCIRSDKPAKSLKVVFLSGCHNLVEFSVVTEKLELLDLSGTGIKELSLSEGQPTKLLHLSLGRCRGLETLPNNLYQSILAATLNLLYCPRLERLPPIPDIPLYIRSLDLDYCLGFSELPENLGNLSILRNLSLRATGVETLPVSIRRLNHLKVLDVGDCRRLRALPELPLSLCSLDAGGCVSLETVPSIAPTALMKKCFRGQNKRLLPSQNQEPNTSPSYDYCKEEFNFAGCTKLDEKASKTILGNAAIRIKYAAYISSLAEASADPYHQLYLCSEASDPEAFDYTFRLSFLKDTTIDCVDSQRIEDEDEYNTYYSSTFCANFNGISYGDLKRLAFALELNNEENTGVDFDTNMQRICMQRGFPIPKLRYNNRLWYMGVEVNLPGSRVPRWIRDRTTQTPFIITIQPRPSHLLGFALCFVLKKANQGITVRATCEWCLEDAEGNQAIEEEESFDSYSKLSSGIVSINYSGGRFRRILEKLEEIKAIGQGTTFNPKLKFYFTSYCGPDDFKECGVWSVYASDLELENPIESMNLRVQPERNKLKKKEKRNLLPWNCRWQALIMRLKTRKRNRIKLSSISKTKSRKSKVLDEQQQQLPPRKKSNRSQRINDLERCRADRIEKQDELQPLHQAKKMKKRKRNAEK